MKSPRDKPGRKAPASLPGDLAVQGLSVAVMLLGWEIAARALGLALVLPGPGETFGDLLHMAGEGRFWASMGATSLRVAESFGVALVLCLPLGILMGRSRFLWNFLHPPQALFRSMPVISVILVALLLIPDAGQVAVAVSFLMIFPILLSSIAEGSLREDPALVEVARCYGFGPLRRLGWITLPWLAPWLLSAGRSALGIAWKAVAAAEVLASPRTGLGSMMQDGRMELESGRVLALTLALLVLSLVSDLLWHLALSFRRETTPRAEMVPDSPRDSAGPGLPYNDGAVPVPEVPFPGEDGRILVRVRNLRFAWEGGGELFGGLDLDLRDRELTVVMAPSGHGKTTLCRIVAGLEQPSQGAVAFPGDPEVIPVFQEPRLLPWATVERNALLAMPSGQADPAPVKKFAEMLELEDSLGMLPAELSGGMRHRAALLRALCRISSNRPSLLILDEPFQGMDHARKERILPRLAPWLAAPGRGALLVTHHGEDADLSGCRVRHFRL